ncbi:hypothetical protein PHLGIDRAFT_18557, partial [Phlebiopsis gigantea 11061_1 CR5-6]
MSGLLGLGAFGVGMLPLLFTFSQTAIARLSSLGTGLLLGTALGVIVPEGVETIALTNAVSHFPTTTIALSLTGGFTFMLLVERIIHRVSTGPHSHMSLPTAPPSSEPSVSISRVEFDVELGDLEREEGFANGSASNTPPPRHGEEVTDNTHVYPLTLGLIVHALADGFALGASATSPIDRGLSITVFLALIIHKAPTVLALTTSLLATGLPRPDCRKHVAVFSAATPVGAILVYFLLSFVHINSESPWTGVAMLISGGTFLYVATVLQPGKSASEELDEKTRMAFVVCGIFTPVIIGALVGHDH